MESPFIYFIAFVIFLLCQYAIWVVCNFIAHLFSLTGKVYWAVVVVAFLLLNNLCFGAYEFGFGGDGEDDDWNDWLGDDE